MSNTQNLIKFARNLTATKQLNFVGQVNVSTGTIRWYPDVNIIIQSVYISAGTAPSGGALSLVINKSGVAAANVSLDSGLNISNTSILNIPVSTAEYITVDVISSNRATDAVLTFTYKRN